MPRPCNGVGGSPRPGADSNAGILYLSTIRDAGSAGFVHSSPDGGSVIDEDEAREWIEALDRRTGNNLPGPMAYGSPIHARNLMSFCDEGPPSAEDLAGIRGFDGIQQIAAFALAERWHQNCTCGTPAPPTLPIYPRGCDSYGVRAGHKIIPANPPGMDYGPNEFGFSWECVYRLHIGLPIRQPEFLQDYRGWWGWYVLCENLQGIRKYEDLTPTSPSGNPAHYFVDVAEFHPCDFCDDDIVPIEPPPPPPPPPSGIILPPISIRPPTIEGPPILIILPPTNCQFTAECKRKLDEAHEVLGTDGFPAKLPETLFDPSKEGEKSYKNYAELLEWLIVQLDGLFGEFPIKIKYKDAQNEEQEIKVENQSEAMAEVIGLLIGIAADTETNTQMGMKSIVETIRATAAATIAGDYAKANAEFLGYRSKDSQSDIKLSISPGATNLKDSLKESTRKIQRFKFDDNADLQDYLRRLLVGVGIVKAAFYRPFGGLGDFLPGDRIKDEIIPPPEGYETQEDALWREFLAEVQTPPSRYRRDSNLPSVDIDNVSTQDPPNTTQNNPGGSR